MKVIEKQQYLHQLNDVAIGTIFKYNKSYYIKGKSALFEGNVCTNMMSGVINIIYNVTVETFPNAELIIK